MYYQRTLSNGLRVVAQKMEGFRSVSVGIWTQTGSANEACEKERGITHFIEHMLFKGTQTRTAQQIAEEMDAFGGILNAFTSKECTCYHARVAEEQLDATFDLLSDLVLHSKLDPQEMEKEKGVVVEEINMSEDTPEDLVHDLLAKAYFGDHPLGLPILGNVQSVQGFTRQDLADYMQRRYVPENLVVSAAGNVDFEHLCDLVEEKMGMLPSAGKAPEQYAAFEPQGSRMLTRVKPIEQAHLCICVPGYAIDDDANFALSVFNNAFGGSMSSRLFQKIREQRGLAYDVYSHPSGYRSCGTFSVYTGVNAAHAEEVVALVIDEMEAIARQGLSKEEFERSKQQLRGNYILGLESTNTRMNAIGKAVTLTGKLRTEEENLAGIDAVTLDGMMDVLPRVLNRSCLCASAVGKIQPERMEKTLES